MSPGWNFGGRDAGIFRELMRVLKELFFPRRVAWQTVSGKSYTPKPEINVPLILAVVAAAFVLFATLFS